MPKTFPKEYNQWLLNRERFRKLHKRMDLVSTNFGCYVYMQKVGSYKSPFHI